MVNRMSAWEHVLSLAQETSLPEQNIHRSKHQALFDVVLPNGVDTAESTSVRAAN